jgi:hypothetical protein
LQTIELSRTTDEQRKYWTFIRTNIPFPIHFLR